MNRDLRELAIILSPNSPRLGRIFCRPKTRLDLRDFFDGPKLAPSRAILGFRTKTLEIMYKSWLLLYESWSTLARNHFELKLDVIWENFLTAQNLFLGGPVVFLARNVANHVQNIANIVWIVIYAFSRSFWAQTRRDLREFVYGPKLAPWRAILVFFSPNAWNHVQIMANIIWIVIYAFPRSFWAQTRRDLREFFDGPKFAPCRAILGFWPKTLEIMYKVLQILYESWSSRSRYHFEPNLASVGANFLSAKNGLLRRLFWVIGQHRWKSCTNHGKYCMNRNLRVAAIILRPNSPRFERLFWRPKIGSLEGHFWFFAQNAENHVQIMENIVWIVI